MNTTYPHPPGKRTYNVRKPKKAELAKRKEKYFEDLKIVRGLFVMLNEDLISSGDSSRLLIKNQARLKRIMDFTKEVYELNPKYQS